MPIIYGTTLTPPKMSDDGQGSRTSIAHHHPAPKGENPRDYPQEQPNAIAKRDGVTFTPALDKGLSHGASHSGGPQLNRRDASAAGSLPSNRGTSYQRVGGGSGRRGVSG